MGRINVAYAIFEGPLGPNNCWEPVAAGEVAWGLPKANKVGGAQMTHRSGPDRTGCH